MDFKKYFKNNFKTLILILIWVILGSAFAAMIPYLSKLVLDNYQSFELKDVLLYIGAYIGSILLFLLFEYLKKIYYNRFECNYYREIKEDIFKAILRRDHYLNNQASEGELVNVMENDCEDLYYSYIRCLLDFLVSIASFIVYVIYLFFIDVYLTPFVLIACLVSLAIPKLVGHKLSKLRKEKSEAQANFIDGVNVLVDARELYDGANYQIFKALFEKDNRYVEQKRNELFDYESFGEIFSGFSLYFINIVVFVSGLLLYYYGKLEISSVVVMLSFIDLVAIPMRDIVYEIITLKSAKDIKGKVASYFGSEAKASIQGFKDKLEVRNLSHNFGEFNLKDINLNIEKGKKYAFIGENGSGKSTSLKLIARELLTEEDCLYLDGEPYDNTYDLSYYSSNPKIFKGSLYDNVTLFDLYKYDEELIASLGLNELLDKEIDNYGENISFGQKARLNIARALLSGKEILFMDEIFANIDQESEKELTTLLLNRDITLVLITHNREAEYLKQFDHIYEFKDGSLIS